MENPKAFVHRYKYNHTKKRKRFKKYLKHGLIKLIERTKEGWLYELLHPDLDNRSDHDNGTNPSHKNIRDLFGTSYDPDVKKEVQND